MQQRIMIHFYFHTKVCEIKTEYVQVRRLCHYSLTLPAILKLFFPGSICYSTGICKPHLPSWLFSGCVSFFSSLYNMEITMLIHLVNCAVMIYPFPSAQSKDVFGFPSDFFVLIATVIRPFIHGIIQFKGHGCFNPLKNVLIQCFIWFSESWNS